MKTKLFTLALLLATSLGGFAQDKNSLKEATKKMIDLTDQGNYEDLSGTVYPKVFDMTSKEDYMNHLVKNKKATDYTVHMIRIDPSIDYGAVKRSSNGYFSLVNYDQIIKIEFDDAVTIKDRQAKVDSFKKLFDTEGVYYIDNSNTIDIKRRVQVVAIADEATGSRWTFVDSKVPFANEIFNKEIRDELNPDAATAQAPAAATAKPKKGKSNVSSVEAEVEKKRIEKEAILKSKKN